MNHSQLPLSPTGRFSQTEPEVQHFPGTPEARAQSRKLERARKNRPHESTPLIQMDISELELRHLAHYAEAGFMPVKRPQR